MARQASRLLPDLTDFFVQKGGPPYQSGTWADKFLFAHFRLKQDIAGLFPYINAVAASSGYFPQLPFIRFVLDGFCCGLHPTHGVSASFADRQQALDFLERLLDFLNGISRRRDRLKPDYRAWHPVPPLHIYQVLPRTNCRACGYPSCLAFAAALSRRKTRPERCPGLGPPLSLQAVYPVLDHRGNLVSTLTLEVDPDTSNPQPAGDQSQCANVSPPPSNSSIALVPLSSREKEVLRLVAQGATNPEIATRLELSRHTVKSHIISIFNKLAVNDRTQAAVLAIRHHLL